jgi:hypothetical protein
MILLVRTGLIFGNMFINAMHCLKSIASLLLVITAIDCGRNAEKGKSINLVPERPSPSPDYWCTWGAQNYATDTFSVKHTLSLGGHSVTAGYLTEKNVFGEKGWSESLPDILRQDLILLFDLGWDIPATQKFENAQWMLGSLRVADDKFPSCKGNTEERLKKLNKMVIDAGWKGTGLWLPSHPHGDRKDGINMQDAQLREYYREGLRISRDAGIKYWKIDYGFRGGDLEFRDMITRMAEESAPGLYIEHGRGGGPLNDEECPWDTKNIHKTGSYRKWDDGRILQKAVDIARISHVFRTYDITQQLSVPTTLDRVAQILLELSGSGEEVLINCEDEPYIGAVLGCAIGILRHSNMIEISGYNYDPFNFKHRIDEVIRAVRWHRIAPPFGAGIAENLLDSVMLTDSWKFKPGDGWATWVTNREVIQIAPARVTRGMQLPEVVCTDEPPYVICCTYPDKAVAVGTLPRISADNKIYYPLADVTIHIEDVDQPIGIFGRFKSLIINFPVTMSLDIERVYGQDLAGTEAIDISEMIAIQPGKMVIPGKVISMIGLSAASEGDLSEPGMVLKIIK